MLKLQAATKEVHFEKGPIVSTLLIYTVPILLTQLLQQLYNITDCIIVGRFCGEYGLSSVGMVAFIVNIFINFFIGFSTGIGVVVAQEFGRYNFLQVKKTICTMVNIGMIAGVILSAIGMALSGCFLTWVKCPPEMFDVAYEYMFICFIGVLPQLIYNIGNAILRALGDTRTALYYLIFSSILNVGLDLLLVVKFEMGLAGAAIATVASQWVIFFMMLVRLSRMDKSYSYKLGLVSRNGLGLTFKEIGHVIGLSLPSGMQAIFMSISSFIVQISINSFGTAAIAGMTIYSKMEGFVYYPAFAYGIALTGFVGQNYGAQCMDRIKKAVRLSLTVSTAIYVPLSLLVLHVSPKCLQLFTSNPDIIHNGYQALLWNLPLYFLFMINQIYLGTIKGLGKTIYPMICTLVCYCIFRAAWCQFLIPVFNSMIVVYTGYDASWVLLIGMLIPYYRKVLKEKEKDCVLH